MSHGLLIDEMYVYEDALRRGRTVLYFWRGFEAALLKQARGKSYEEALDFLRQRYPDVCRTEAFRHGFERGHAHHEELVEMYTTKA